MVWVSNCCNRAIYGWGLSRARVSALLQRRADELGINPVVQGREDKLTALNELLETMEIGMDEIAFMGDDLPDLSRYSTR